MPASAGGALLPAGRLHDPRAHSPLSGRRPALHHRRVSTLPPAPNPALTPAAAAAYCGVSLRHFERHLAPALPCVDLRAPGATKAMPRYRIADLDAFLASRTVPPVAPRPNEPR